MTLEEYVLTAKDSEGKIIINIADYYDRYIMPLDNKFRKWSYHTHSTVLCCWKDHNDLNPSLGSINHKFYKGVKLYHCLGCGATGTVIRMHQRIQKEYYNRDITEKQSCIELCELFGVDAKAYLEVKDVGDQTNAMERLRRMNQFKHIYTIRDYTSDLKAAKCNNQDDLKSEASAVNTANIKYIATKKRLYS